jgi:hypothetical protein
MSSRIPPKLPKHALAADVDEQRSRSHDRSAGVAARNRRNRAWRAWVVEEPAPARVPVGRFAIHARETPRRWKRRRAIPMDDGRLALLRRLEHRRGVNEKQRAFARHGMNEKQRAFARHGVNEAPPHSAVVARYAECDADTAPPVDDLATSAHAATDGRAARVARHARQRSRSCRAIGGTRLPRATSVQRHAPAAVSSARDGGRRPASGRRGRVVGGGRVTAGARTRR